MWSAVIKLAWSVRGSLRESMVQRVGGLTLTGTGTRQDIHLIYYHLEFPQEMIVVPVSPQRPSLSLKLIYLVT